MTNPTEPKGLFVTDNLSQPDIKRWQEALHQYDLDSEVVVITQIDELDEDFVIVVIDLMRLDDDMLHQIRVLRSQTPSPILLISAQENQTDTLAAYDAGVDDCLYKPLNPDIFEAKVKAWLKHTVGAPGLDSALITVGDFVLFPADGTLQIASGQKISLTRLENRLLHALMRRPSVYISPDVLATAVWGPTAGDRSLVKHVVYRLRKKIEADSSDPQHIVYDRDTGYSFQP